MRNLQREFFRAQDLSEELDGEFLYSNKYKKDREWWVLGSLFNLLQASDEYCYIKAHEQESPDFTLHISSRESNLKIEVCANVELWVEQNLINLKKAKFQQIFVINSSVNELLSIHPEFKVFHSKYKQYFQN